VIGFNGENNNHVGSMATMFMHTEWIQANRAPSLSPWEHRSFEERAVYPIPNYPALLHKDTSPGNKGDDDCIKAENLAKPIRSQ